MELLTGKLQNHQQSTPKVIWNMSVAVSKIIETFNQINKVTSTQKYGAIDYQKSPLSKLFDFNTTQSFLNILNEG